MKNYTQAAKRLFAKNALSLERMAQRAALTGRKVNGYTQRELENMADEALACSKQGEPSYREQFAERSSAYC